MKKKSLVVVLLLVVASIYASGQKNEISFVVGGTFSPDSTAVLRPPLKICIIGVPNCTTIRDSARIDTKVGIEGVYGRRIVGNSLASLYLELLVLGVPNREVRPAPLATIGFVPPVPSLSTPHDFSSIFFTPSLKLKVFPAAIVAPFISAGGGFAHYSSTTQQAASDVRSSTSNTTGAFQIGGGLDIKTPIPHLGFRAEVREFRTGQPQFSLGTKLDHHNNLFAGGGIVFHF